MSIDITGKWAFITGAKSGIGRTVAIELSRLGAHLVLHARHTTDLAEVVETIRVQSKGRTEVVCIEGDLSVDADVDALVPTALKASGGIDILYNNAAIMCPNREPFWTATADDYRRCFQINFVAPVRITGGLLPSMLKRKFGRIVQITSGIRDQPNLMAYAASKAALDKYVRDCAARLRHTGVLMNLLDPGWLRTNLGGPNAPSDVSTVLPGALVPALLDGEVHGVWFSAQDFTKND
jgi:NAD(P)-dependent dehydrogenase (short-subunit alcohol dehydrogenase family)